MTYTSASVYAQDETPIPTPEPTATPIPTPSPEPKVVPGSALELNSDSLYEYLSQIDIIEAAKLVVIGLGVIWAAIISVAVVKEVSKKL